MYLPDITNAVMLRRLGIDKDRSAVLLGNIEASGSIRYAFLLVVFAGDAPQPLFVVSSELRMIEGGEAVEASVTGALAGASDQSPDLGSHFLCAFTSDAHCNYGAEDRWGDEVEFETQALSLAQHLIAEHVGSNAEYQPWQPSSDPG